MSFRKEMMMNLDSRRAGAIRKRAIATARKSLCGIHLIRYSLRFLRTLLYIVRDNRDIAVVERGIDLVEEVAGNGGIGLQGKDQCKTGQRLLSSGKVGSV